MKVKILRTGQILEAKRLTDLTDDEIKASIGSRNSSTDMWEDKDIFVKSPSEEENYWNYVFDEEVEILKEEIANVQQFETKNS